MSEIKKIIFFHEHYFSKNYYSWFGIELLIDRGFQVEVWCFKNLLKSKNYLKSFPPNQEDRKWYKEFNNKKSAIKAIRQIKDDTVIMSGIHYLVNSFFVYRALAKSNIKTFTLLAQTRPAPEFKQHVRWWKKIKKIFNKNAAKTITDSIFNRIPYNFWGIKPVDVILATGENYFKTGYPSNEKSKILWVHNWDYDLYLNEKKIPDEKNEKIGVFLDENLSYHPDNEDMGYPHVPPDEYYRLLREFFDYLEANTGRRIVIAAHPSSRYEDLSDHFGNRETIRYRTAELVKKSDFVITHQSTSRNFAVLFRKPIIFITTDDVDKYMIAEPSPKWFADYFGKKLYNLNHGYKINFSEELSIDDTVYNKYINDYVKKHGSPEKLFWDIVADYIKTL